MAEWILTDKDIGMDGAYYDYPELVRCKDCIKKPICTIYLETNDDYGYCSMAERKPE